MAHYIFLICCLLLASAQSIVGEDDVSEEVTASNEKLEEAEKKMSEKVMAILNHYKQEDPVGLPGAPVQDPMSIPDLKHSFSVAKMNFKEANVYGLSKFRIEYVRSDLAAMEVSVGLRLEKLEIRGNYVMSTWISKSAGLFNVTLLDVFVEGKAFLEVDRTGRLQAQDIKMDITFSTIMIKFENLGFMGNLFQSIINSVGTFLFDSIKPFILRQVNTEIRGTINEHIDKIPQRFPNSISPFDMAIAEARKTVRDLQYDPYQVPNYNYSAGIFKVDLTNTWLTGVSSFYRVGNVTVSILNNTVHVSMNVGTQKLRGQCNWEVSAASVLSKAGRASFTVEYLQVSLDVSQTLDTRNKPKIDDLNLRLGNIQARMDGAGTLDYVIEFLVNILPNLLRYQIMDAVEGPLKRNLQAHLDSLDVEAILEEKLPAIDSAMNSLN